MRINRRLLTCMFVMVMAFSFIVVPESVQAKTATLSKKKIVLIKGQKKKLKVKNAGRSAISWKSKNKKIAAVSKAGKITAKKKGKTVVTATVISGSKKKKLNCKVYVETPKLSAKGTELKVGDSQNITLKGTTQKVKWKSSNNAIVSVKITGKNKAVLTANYTGKAKITATVLKKKYSCDVVVKAKPAKTQPNDKPEETKPDAKPTETSSDPELATIAVTSVSLDKTSATINVGASISLTASIAPTNSTNKAVIWKSDKTSIATVSSAGKVTGVAPGKANITATAGGKSASCIVTVNAENQSENDEQDTVDSTHVVIDGVTFDISKFKSTKNITSTTTNPELFVTADRTVSLSDFEFVINGGKIYYLGDNTEWYKVIGDNGNEFNNVAVTPSWDTMVARVSYGERVYYTGEIVYGFCISEALTEGSFPVKILYKGQLVAESTVTVSCTSKALRAIREDADDIKANTVLTGDETKLEKLYKYHSKVIGRGYACDGGATLFMWLARDLGYKARYAYTDEPYNQATYWALASAVYGNHVDADIACNEGNTWGALFTCGSSQ